MFPQIGGSICTEVLQIYRLNDRKRGIRSCSNRSKMSVQHSDALHGLRRIDTGDFELHPHASTAIGKNHLVGELLHDKNTFALQLLTRGQRAIVFEIESGTLVLHLGEDATAASAESDRDLFAGVGTVAMHRQIRLASHAPRGFHRAIREILRQL